MTIHCLATVTRSGSPQREMFTVFISLTRFVVDANWNIKANLFVNWSVCVWIIGSVCVSMKGREQLMNY